MEFKEALEIGALEPLHGHEEPVKFQVGVVCFKARGDRVIVLEDSFRSGYDCTTCYGTGKVACTDCDNGKSRVNAQIQCKTCSGETTHQCPDCKGKGALIYIPEKSQRRPTVGKLVSVGEKVLTFHVGQKVMYGSYAGHEVNLEDKGKSVNIRILHDTEILCEVEGDMLYRRASAGDGTAE